MERYTRENNHYGERILSTNSNLIAWVYALKGVHPQGLFTLILNTEVPNFFNVYTNVNISGSSSFCAKHNGTYTMLYIYIGSVK